VSSVKKEQRRKEGLMTSPIALLREQAEDAERRAKRLHEMAEFAERLGEDGLSEFVAMIAVEAPDGNGHINGNSKENVPRGREAVRQIVAERPGIWTMAELRAEMKHREWFTSNKGLDVAVSRLCESGEGQRVGRGRYVFPRKEGAIDSDPSDGAMIPLNG
jgi:hypothetical protein